MAYALQLNGSIRVGVTTDDVIEPFQLTMYSRYTSIDAAIRAKQRIVDSKVCSKSATSIKIVEVN